MMDDPIFAAIACYEKAAAAFMAQCEYEDWLKAKGIKLPCAADDHRTREMVTLVNARIAARVALAKTAPTTLAGLAALTGFLRQHTTTDVLSFFEGEENRAFVPRSAALVRCWRVFNHPAKSGRPAPPPATASLFVFGGTDLCEPARNTRGSTHGVGGVLVRWSDTVRCVTEGPVMLPR